MIITKQHRNLVYAYLFKEGVMVAKKDFFLKKHHLISEVTNLEVIVMMRSLISRKYITENFNWGWYYWYLNNDGINYLRSYLHLPENIVPNTLKKQSGEREHEHERAEGEERRPRRYDGERKAGGAPGEFNPEFSGRGRRGGRGGSRGGRGGRFPRTERPAAPATEAPKEEAPKVEAPKTETK